MHKLFLLPLLAACVTSVSAQRFGSAPHFFPRSFPHAPGSRGGYYPVAFFPDFDYRYFDNSGASSPVIVLQLPPQTETVQPYVPAQPLLIELQGDRYVRVSGEETSATHILDEKRPIQTAGDSASTDLNAGVSTPAELRRTVLVFSDGHREELGRYTISNGVLYAEADVYTGGSWNRTVPLASLNLPETMNENQSRGMRFKLPTAPNEVIVGP